MNKYFNDLYFPNIVMFIIVIGFDLLILLHWKLLYSVWTPVLLNKVKFHVDIV